jgi:hypothetical protein
MLSKSSQIVLEVFEVCLLRLTEVETKVCSEECDHR